MKIDRNIEFNKTLDLFFLSLSNDKIDYSCFILEI